MNQNEIKGTVLVGDALLGIKDLSEILCMSTTAIRVALCRGTFPMQPIKLGNRLRWRASDVRTWLATAGSEAAK